MPVKRRTLTQTAFFRKLLLYHATAVQKLHSRRFGFKAFRLLTVTASPDRERVTWMIGAAQELDSMKRIFVSTDEESLLSGDALTREWLNDKKEQAVLGPRVRGPSARLSRSWARRARLVGPASPDA